MKRWISVLLAACMLLTVVACAQETEEPATTEAPAATEAVAEETAEAATETTDKTAVTGEITVAQHRTDLEEQFAALIAAFNEEYPNVVVNVETIADYQNTMPVRIAGGEVPDVLEIKDLIVPRAQWVDYFQPVDDCNVLGKFLFEDYFTVDGKCYAVSETAGYRNFMYNKTLWAQAGITDVPTTWAELEADLALLSQIDGIIPFTTQYTTTWCQRSWIDHFAMSVNGADWKNGWVDTDTPFSNEAMITILNGYKNIIDMGYCDPDLTSSEWDLQSADFAAGTIATYLCGNYAYATMTALGMDGSEIGFFAMPDSELTSDGNCTLFAMPDWGWGISKSCSDENYAAACALVEFLSYNYANYTSQLPAEIGAECAIEPINEMLATNPTIVSDVAPSDDFTAINNLAAITIGNIVQEYVVADDPQSVIDAYNAKWAAARAEYYGNNG